MPEVRNDKQRPSNGKNHSFGGLCPVPGESPECPGCVDVPLFHVRDGETAGVEKGEKVRFIVLEDVKGQTVTIFIESSAVGFEEFLAKGQKVVDSVKWSGS
jgi:hypothetical protein